MPGARRGLPGLNRTCQEALRHWAVTVNSDWQHVISPLSASASSVSWPPPSPCPLYKHTLIHIPHTSAPCAYCTYHAHTHTHTQGGSPTSLAVRLLVVSNSLTHTNIILLPLAHSAAADDAHLLSTSRMSMYTHVHRVDVYWHAPSN